jgi:hypothetical protein
MKKSQKIAKEVAEKEFERFADAMDLDVDEKEMSEQELDAFMPHKLVLLKALQRGTLVINDNGEPAFTPKMSENSKPLVFKEPTGAALMAMDRRKSNESMARLYAMMGDMTSTNANTFAKLAWRDLKVCQAITTLFLA